MKRLNFYVFVSAFFSLGIILGLSLVDFLFKNGTTINLDYILLLSIIVVCNLMLHNLQYGDNDNYHIIPQLFN